VLAADWGCAGEVRAVVLRVATGEVLLYAPLRPDGAGPEVERAERVHGATGLGAQLVDGCAAPVVQTEGRSHVLHLDR
jgi:hypothetical protein